MRAWTISHMAVRSPKSLALAPERRRQSLEKKFRRRSRLERRASGAQRGAHGFSPKISLSWLVFLCRSVSSRSAYFNATVLVEGGASRVIVGKDGVTSKGIFSWGERRATGLTCIISR